ncbi:MAG: hypothetical protein KA354_16380 [Phycisphaerae bacterium]|nr:hypothetical protein [Phycisphaerae bacterium]
MNIPGPAEPSVFRMNFKRPGPRAWVRVGAAATEAVVRVNGLEVGRHLGAWTPFEFEITAPLREQNLLEIHCQDRDHLTNGFLPWLQVRWSGARDVEIRTEPTSQRPAARSRARADGTTLVVDGTPFNVRGILHWGYYPELRQPNPSEEQIRREIADVKSLGFNLIKFCLWIPPERYYQLCEELGMWMWQEYPVWAQPLEDRSVVREYEEYFRHDRPYSRIILRSLTCENDHVDPVLGRELVDLAHKMIPGCLIVDNSGWLCSERHGDFQDEHVYLNNMQMQFYGRRIKDKLTKPFVVGEGFQAQTACAGPHELGVEVRRQQIELLLRDLPNAGYVITAMREPPPCHNALYDRDGRLKCTPEQWAWQTGPPGTPRPMPPPGKVVVEHGVDRGGGQENTASSSRLNRLQPDQVPVQRRGVDQDPVTPPAIIGPRKGEWKCPDHTWHSTHVAVLDPALPARLIREEAHFDLLSGRVLSHCEGTRVLVEVQETWWGKPRRFPVVIEFMSQGQRMVVSAFRHDTPAGRELGRVLQDRDDDAPEIGPLVGTSIVLEDWEMSLDEREWHRVKCDTPLVNRGRNIFEGWATFRTCVDYPGGKRMLHCDSVGDYYEVFIDGQRIGEAGPRHGTWDGTRDIPRDFEVSMPAGRCEVVFRVRDWRGAGGMIGPVFFATDLAERIL